MVRMWTTVFVAVLLFCMYRGDNRAAAGKSGRLKMAAAGGEYPRISSALFASRVEEETCAS